MLAFIVSLPRSGSTVLTSLLDQKLGVICHPESSFPQIYGELSDSVRKNPAQLAAYYLASTFSGTPLTLQEAEDCMSASLEETLYALGAVLAVKTGRPADEAKVIVWKTTRNVGMCRSPMLTQGKFVVLRRHPHNVFESQFRVGFGKSNRNPFRFALFRQSYESAFAKLPADRRIDINYDDLPDCIPNLLDFIGVNARGEWQTGHSSLDAVARNRPWLSEITKSFQNRDAEKRSRLSITRRTMLGIGLTGARLIMPLAPAIRSHFDQLSLNTIRQNAENILRENSDIRK